MNPRKNGVAGWLVEARRALIPYALRRKLAVFRERLQSGLTWHRDVIHRIDAFRPNSGNNFAFPELTYSAVNRLPAQLCQLLNEYGHQTDGYNQTTVDEFANTPPRLEEFQNAFRKHGSDKSTTHDYFRVYALILSRTELKGPISLLEIGIGTDNPALISTMGSSGVPGASLRAFKELLPDSMIFGADIDRGILFGEDRIRTAWVDQCDPSSFQAMTTELGQTTFDIIIDDGLHSIEANMNTLLFGLKALKNDGWIIIEDIPDRSRHLWAVIGYILGTSHFRCSLIRCKRAWMFAVSSGSRQHRPVGQCP